MAEYIEREAVLSKAWDADTRCGYVQVVDVGDVIDIPAADVAPVVHGRWKGYSEKHAFSEECSVCGCGVMWDDGRLHRYNYCPNCGARMDGE